MVVRIAYKNTLGERHELEWICPSNFTVERVVSCFKSRHPGATVLATLRLDAPCTLR
jgi:hypothetical protein